MRKLLLIPLRLSVGWSLSPRLLSFLAAVMLVLLRVSIGWHFYTEGLDKAQTKDWDSAPFFANARGPFADHFRGLVWDREGTVRLEMDATKLWLATYRDRVGRHYGFDAAQKELAQTNYSDTVRQLEDLFKDDANKVELEKFENGLQRLAALNKDPSREGVATLQGQRETIRKEVFADIAPIFAEIDAIWANYEADQNSVASDSQQLEHGRLGLGKPAVGMMDTERINSIVPYLDMAIGLCLLLGLFTPVAALIAAGFLGSVFVSQLPPSAGPTSTHYQLVESMACLVLAATGAGRMAGLDYFLHLIVRSVWGTPPSKG